MSAELQSEQHIRKKMGAAGLAEPTILAFLSAARRVARGERGMLPEASLEPLKALPRLDEITEAGQENESLLDQLAHAGLADMYAVPAFYGFSPPAALKVQAERYASRAMALKPDLAESNFAAGICTLWLGHWPGARAKSVRAWFAKLLLPVIEPQL